MMSSMVSSDRSLMVDPASGLQLMYQKPWWDGTYLENIAHESMAAGFLFLCVDDSLPCSTPYNRK